MPAKKSFMPSARFLAQRCCMLVPIVLLFGCKPEGIQKAQKPPAAPPAADQAQQRSEDLRIGRNAMPISEVVAALAAGVPKEKVLEEVRRRRVTGAVVDATELQLAANGAGRELIAALKDPKNHLTPTQEAAYMQLVVERQRSAVRTKR